MSATRPNIDFAHAPGCFLVLYEVYLSASVLRLNRCWLPPNRAGLPVDVFTPYRTFRPQS